MLLDNVLFAVCAFTFMWKMNVITQVIRVLCLVQIDLLIVMVCESSECSFSCNYLLVKQAAASKTRGVTRKRNPEIFFAYLQFDLSKSSARAVEASREPPTS